MADFDVEGESRRADTARRVAAGLVAAIAGTMLVAWLAGLDAATRTDNLAPMSPLACVGFLAAAAGVWCMPRRLAMAFGLVTAACGAAGLLDVIVAGGATLNRTVFGADTRVSAVTAEALILLGAAIALDGRQWAVTYWMALGAGALGAAAAIGFLLAVPIFYGPSRSVHISWQASVCVMLVALGIASAHPTGLLFDPGLGGRFTRRTLPAVIAIPVVAGALSTAAARAGWWPFSTAAWVMTLTAVAGLVVVVAMAARRLAEDDRRLTELAIRDPLTGAYNRRHFLSHAEAAAARTRRYGEPGAIAVIDLDHFKEINDQWGHQTGDEVLVRTHRALRTRLRSSDVLGRIGGDEFAAVILRVDAHEAQRVAGELRDAVAGVGAELMAGGLRNRLGASVGIATLDASDDVESLIDLADQRMYADKRDSREQVESGADH